MVEFRIGDCTIAVRLGDITQVEADAVVNPANSRMIMGGGVAGALRRAGGPEIEKEALQRAPISVGQSVATTSGRLKAKYVIHAPTMPRPAMSATTANVAKATAAALRLAKQLKLSSIAVPGMGTGVGGVPVQEAAKTMIEVIKQHLSEGTSLKQILLISTDETLTDAFQFALEHVST